MSGRYDCDNSTVSACELADNELKAGSSVPVQATGDEHGERRGVALHIRHSRRSVVAGKAESERNFERNDQPEGKKEETGEEPPPH